MGRTHTIILIEDSPDDAFLVNEALNHAGFGFSLTVFSDGTKAMSFLGGQARFPDLFLVDLNLPTADGFDLIRKIREHPRSAGTRVMVLSSSDSPRDHSRAQSLGIDGYFCKPLDLDEFLKLGGMVGDLLKGAPTLNDADQHYHDGEDQ